MKLLSLVVAVVAATMLTGFRVAPKTYDQGYSDGYAIGYRTTCSVGATRLNGDWDSPSYKRGYVHGLRAGVRACLGGRRYGRRY